MKRFYTLLIALLCVASLSAQNIAVLDFSAGTGVNDYEVKGISEIFNTYFSPKRYTLVERTLIDNVTKEQNFQDGDLTQNQMVLLGEILNVSKIVYGSISIIAYQYQVDVRAVDVQTGEIVAKGGFTWNKSTDYRTAIAELATNLADKVDNVVEPAPIRERTKVEELMGYLKVYPHDLGIYPFIPSNIIAQINKQHLHDYDSWRIPSDEELALLRNNNYLNRGRYMSTSTASSSGIVLLVTDAEESYSERIARIEREAEERRLAEKAEAERLAAEKAEAERLAAEKAEAERLAAEKAEAERLAAIKAAEEAARLKNQSQVVPATRNRRHPIAPIKKGYQQEISTAYSWMANYESTNMLNVNYIGGVRFGHHFYLGIGTGFDFTLSNCGYQPHVMQDNWNIYYDDDRNSKAATFNLPLQILSIPLYGHFKLYFAKTKWAPFLAFSGGVRFSKSKYVDIYNGAYYFGDYNHSESYGAVSGMFEVMPGISCQLNKNTAINFQLGYATRQLYSWGHNSNSISTDYWYHGLTARFGIVF